VKTARLIAEIIQHWDAATRTVQLAYPRMHLETPSEITALFDTTLSFWRTHCGGKPVYYVVDYGGLTFDLALIDHYAREQKRVMNQCALGAVRYGGDPLQRAAARLVGVKNQMRSNLFDTREEALAALEALRAKDRLG
jgi:hypothetical protein